jgi:drug/metabolite transporter (DMT)-like permease
MLIFVVFFWGIDPIINANFYKYYSAAVFSTILTFFAFLFFFILSIKKLKLLNRDYLKIAVPICALNAVACLLQRIGLQYTTPAHYAFLDHLTCVSVPIMLFVYLKKKPQWDEVTSCALCLCGCFILTGMSFSDLSLGIGDVLCGTAGLLLGVCSSSIAVFAKKLDITLYMMIHTAAYFLVSLILAISLSLITVDGVPMEAVKFTPDPLLLTVGAIFGLVDIAICWLCRTEAVTHIGPTTVTVVMPLCAVITGVVSVILGMDKINQNLLIGGAIVLVALLLPTICDIIRNKLKKSKHLANNDSRAEQ